MTEIKQPNSRFCFVCGLENAVGLHLHFFETAPGQVEASFVPSENYQGYPGVLHGGVVGALIDEVSGRAHMGSDPQSPRFMYTAKLEVRYRRNVPVGRKLTIIGKARESKGRRAVAWGGIYDAETGDLLAEGTTTLVEIPAGALERSRLAELGWKVYPQ